MNALILLNKKHINIIDVPNNWVINVEKINNILKMMYINHSSNFI